MRIWGSDGKGRRAKEESKGRGRGRDGDATHVQHTQVPLPSQRSEHNRPRSSSLSNLLLPTGSDADETPPRISDGLSAHLAHLAVVVDLASELLVVGVVPEGGDGWIGDHDRFEVEAAVANVPARGGGEGRDEVSEERAKKGSRRLDSQQSINIGSQLRRRAPEDLPW